MAKFYVQSGGVRLVFDARDEMEAAVKAFQWTCEQQATIDALTCVEHTQIAEQRGWQLQDEVQVHEQGFDRKDAYSLCTIDVLEAWQSAMFEVA